MYFINNYKEDLIVKTDSNSDMLWEMYALYIYHVSMYISVYVVLTNYLILLLLLNIYNEFYNFYYICEFCSSLSRCVLISIGQVDNVRASWQAIVCLLYELIWTKNWNNGTNI